PESVCPGGDHPLHGARLSAAAGRRGAGVQGRALREKSRGWGVVRTGDQGAAGGGADFPEFPLSRRIGRSFAAATPPESLRAGLAAFLLPLVIDARWGALSSRGNWRTRPAQCLERAGEPDAGRPEESGIHKELRRAVARAPES